MHIAAALSITIMKAVRALHLSDGLDALCIPQANRPETPKVNSLIIDLASRGGSGSGWALARLWLWLALAVVRVVGSTRQLEQVSDLRRLSCILAKSVGCEPSTASALHVQRGRRTACSKSVEAPGPFQRVTIQAIWCRKFVSQRSGLRGFLRLSSSRRCAISLGKGADCVGWPLETASRVALAVDHKASTAAGLLQLMT